MGYGWATPHALTTDNSAVMRLRCWSKMDATSSCGLLPDLHAQKIVLGQGGAHAALSTLTPLPTFSPPPLRRSRLVRSANVARTMSSSQWRVRVTRHHMVGLPRITWARSLPAQPARPRTFADRPGSLAVVPCVMWSRATRRRPLAFTFTFAGIAAAGSSQRATVQAWPG